MKLVYLDTSAIVKRYIQEPGSDVVESVYSSAWQGEVKIAFSLWNIGEVLGVLDKYYRRGWVTRNDYQLARREFLGESLSMLKLRALKVVPIKTSILAQSWELVEKHHIHQADALQIVASRMIGAEEFYTADEALCKVTVEEKLNTRCFA
jgi:predicted nucleic acid-binding protein